MATLIRSPLVQGAQHPQKLLSSVFTPVNLLVTTLGIATAIPLPLNANAMDWTQVQHPSNLRLNPDSSLGTPKTLINEIAVPTGINQYQSGVSNPDRIRSVVDTTFGTPYAILQAPVPVGPIQILPPPELRRSVVDTSKGSPRVLTTELVLPVGTNGLLNTASEPIRTIVDTSHSAFQFVTPSPIIPPAHYGPVKYWFNSLDTSASVPKVLYSESIPIGTPRQPAATPDPIRSVVNTTIGTSIALFPPAPMPFTPILHSAPTMFWFQPQDASVSTAKVLYPDAPVVVTPDIIVTAGGNNHPPFLGHAKFRTYRDHRHPEVKRKKSLELAFEIAQERAKSLEEELRTKLDQVIPRSLTEVAPLVSQSKIDKELPALQAKLDAARQQEEELLILLMMTD